MSNVVINIRANGYDQQPIVTDEVTWKTQRKGAPGELVFTVIKDDKLSFPEGSEVKLEVDGKGVFHGFVFTKSRDKMQHIKVVAYDQLRYLKNKDTLVYADWTCGKLLSYIATAFKLNIEKDSKGNMKGIADTGYKVGTTEDPRVEENSTLFDMILNNLDETVYNTGKLFVLYDDCGYLRLKNADDMKVEYLISDEVGENFDYQSSLDGDVYNKVKLYVEDSETGKRDTYTAQDNSKISQWGVLQYHAKVNNEDEVVATTQAILELYNTPKRTLTVKGLKGDLNVRAGCLVPVHLHLGDAVQNVDSFLMVDSVTHKWSKGHHSMDITLIGRVNSGKGEFTA